MTRETVDERCAEVAMKASVGAADDALRTAAWSSAWRWTTARLEAEEFTGAELVTVADRRKETEARRISVITAASTAPHTVQRLGRRPW
jgi:hypothetical protein